MAEAGCCESCSHYKKRDNNTDFLFRTCDIHRDPIVQKTLLGALERKEDDLAGFSVIDPGAAICNRYAPNYVSIYISKWIDKLRKKKQDNGK